MRIVVARAPLRRIVRWTQRVLLVCGLSLLGYCGFVAIDAQVFQRAESRQLERLLAVNGGALPTALKSLPRGATAGLIGRIEIPRLGLSAIVMEGTRASTLRRAAGHISGTALPGQPGNVGISGHRDTFFRPLRNIRQNDMVTLTTAFGEYRYRVVSTRIVLPNEGAVLDSGEGQILTLVTCYPFYFVGPAPRRFIVRAERVANTL